MVMKITKKELENIKKSVDKLVKQGSTIEYAVSAIASQNNINMGQLMKVLYPKSDNNYKNEYKDIKTSVGTYAVLKSNPNIRYEVIKINNKEDIKLRDLMTNKIIKAKEEEILPIVTENNMKKNLKEANYNLSIDGLETIDADKLSQILTLAGEAEGNVTDTTFEPEVDMSDMDLNAYDNPEYDTAVVPTDSLDDMDTTFDTDMSFEQEPTLDDEFGYEDYEQFPVTESKMEEDVLLDPQSDDETYNAQKKDVETDELLSEDEMDDFVNGDVFDESEEIDDYVIEESFGDKIKGKLKNEKIIRTIFIDWMEEAKRHISTNKNIDDNVKTAVNDRLQQYIDKMKKEQQLNEGILGAIIGAGIGATVGHPFIGAGIGYIGAEIVDPILRKQALKLVRKLELKSGDMNKVLSSEYFTNEEKLIFIHTLLTKAMEASEENDNKDVDKEIAECLRLAGVELNEVSEEKATKGKKDLPQIVGHKTVFSKAKQNGFKPGENQRPNYKCVRTKDVMGKESSEGFKEPMNVAKVCCNESKIKSICETASRMYAKKDHSEWLALDRRYVEKLLNEGIGYERASKMLLKAKGGK